jgi:hypothetical protein
MRGEAVTIQSIVKDDLHCNNTIIVYGKMPDGSVEELFRRKKHLDPNVRVKDYLGKTVEEAKATWRKTLSDCVASAADSYDRYLKQRRA